MTRGRFKKSTFDDGTNAKDDEEHTGLTPELAAANPELTEEREETPRQVTVSMTDLETVLREIRDFRKENAANLKDIRDEIAKANGRIDEAERRIVEAEDRVQSVEEATLELLKLQKKIEEKLIDQEGRSRRENIRLHGIKEGAEDNTVSMDVFVEQLLREHLELPATMAVNIERAHRALSTRPPNDAPPRSIIVKLLSYKCKEEIIKRAWEKKGFMYEGRRVIVDHDYAPEIMKRRKGYMEVKKILREEKIRFQTPFPAKLRVFYEGETPVLVCYGFGHMDWANKGQKGPLPIGTRGYPLKLRVGLKKVEFWTSSLEVFANTQLLFCYCSGWRSLCSCVVANGVEGQVEGNRWVKLNL